MIPFRVWLCLSLCLGLLPAPGVAAAPATVEAVQNAAWLEREHLSYTLKAGMALQSGDKLRTGGQARVVVRLPDASTLKLGENAEISLDEIVPPAGENGVFAGVMQILAGAFRFTSETAQPREVQIKVSQSITVGIRGTDVWGKAAPDQDLVCLIEGKVSVRSDKVRAVLDQPRHFFVVPRGKAPLPVGFLEEEKLLKWAQQTELQ